MIAAPSLRVEPSGTCAWTRVAEGTVSTRAAADWQIWRSPASPIGTSGMQGERARPRVMGRLHFHGRAPVSVDRLRHGVGPGDALEVGADHRLVGRDSPRAAVTRPVQRGIAMHEAGIRQLWEGAAPGWARWEATVAAWMEPATEAMLALADIDTGVRVLDLACGAGSQTLDAARRVGVQGSVVASD